MPKIKLDYFFLFTVLALVAVGLITIFSASPSMGIKAGDAFYYIKRHLFYLLLGFMALYYALYLDLEKLKSKSHPILFFSVVILLLVFIPGVGRKVLGASRWIELGIISLQPSELVKFAMVFFLAGWFSEKKDRAKNLSQGIVFPLVVFAFISLLIMKQPDMGTVIILAATVFSMLFIAGAQIKYMAVIFGMGVAAALVLSLATPYRLRRLIAYLDPWKDPQGIGFQIIQSLLAIGSGGFFGLGLGGSRQKFFYLPQQFTDFIFAILCEELGFIGGVGVIILFILFAARGLSIALSTADRFKAYLAAGITAWITFQALINILVVVGLIPTTGIPLPFISYGGTATIVNLFAAGIVLNISRKAA